MPKIEEETCSIDSFLSLSREQIETRLAHLVPEVDAPYNRLFQAARYALLGGGKRLRPLLTIATAEAFGVPIRNALNAACAIEMVHAYSLVHDDLPCMDDDDYRRGKPSVHRAFGEGHAVLAGDYLLTQSFEVIAADHNLTPEQKVALISLLARKSGGDGMIAGQVMDIEAEGLAVSHETLSMIHRMKTGALITTSVEFGCILGGATKERTEVLRRFADEIGLAFQIIDDVIDVTHSETKHGKAVASDDANNKTTYVTLFGLVEAEAMALTLLNNALKRLEALPFNTTILGIIAKKLVQRTI